MLDVGVVLNNIVVFVVIRPACQNHDAASCVERRNSSKLICRVCPRVFLRSCQTAGRCGENECLVFCVAAGSNQVCRGVKLHGAHAVIGSKLTEVAHGVFVVACNILVVVGSINTYIHKLLGILNIKLHGLCEGVLVVALLYNGGHGDGGDTGLVRSPLKRNIQSAACSQSIAGVVNSDAHAADGVGQSGDGGIGSLAVKQGCGQSQLLAGDGSGGAAYKVGDTELEHITDPNRGGNSQVAVCFGYADKVVAVIGIKR